MYDGHLTAAVSIQDLAKNVHKISRGHDILKILKISQDPQCTVAVVFGKVVIENTTGSSLLGFNLMHLLVDK